METRPQFPVVVEHTLQIPFTVKQFSCYIQKHLLYYLLVVLAALATVHIPKSKQ
jgi:hypothetical protein